MTLQIPDQALIAIAAHGAECFPNECCGFFFGTDGEPRSVTEVRPVRNSKEGDQRRRFSIDPLDYMAAERHALENEITLLGIYHSHPNHPAIPSGHDLGQAVPFFSYLILSVWEGRPDHLRSWRLTDAGQFQEETVAATALSGLEVSWINPRSNLNSL